ncbi:MAG: DUF192 domain-containing protein [Deltaproteobacteria bacterium]|nr:DUF192 domain-containing protein [Deltaproteobacteria bacterium]
MLAVVVTLAAILEAGACSSGSKRDDAATVPPEQAAPQAVAPVVQLATPTGEVSVAVELATTPPKIEKGLMFREHLGPEAGMLFFMGREYEWSFYMRNTLIPLDMIFITKDLTVAGIVANAEPRTETLRRVPGTLSMYVLEVNGGWAAAHGVVGGAKVRFEHLPPTLADGVAAARSARSANAPDVSK